MKTTRERGARVVFVGTGLALLLAPCAGQGQIVRDGTIGPGSATQPLGPNYTISEDMGSLSGTNLFHSFLEFSVNQGESATFTALSPVDSVISRITGDNPMSVSGLLSSQIPGADFFFVSPNGFMFGPGAALNLSGALHLSTAGQLEFDDGTAFEVRTDTAAILSVAAPTAFGMLGPTAGFMEFSGAGTILRNPSGFELHAGTVTVSDGAALAASTSNAEPGGSIDIFAGDRIILDDAPPFLGNPVPLGTLDSRSTGNGNAGRIYLEAPVIDMIDGGGIGSANLGSGIGAPIEIVASERLTISGPSAINPGVAAQIVPSSAASGSAGAVTIQAPSVVLDEAGKIRSLVFGSGNGDPVQIDADTVELRGASQIATRVIQRGAGRGADITIRATEWITLRDPPPEGEAFGSSIIAKTDGFATGDSGSIMLEAPVVEVLDGARIDTGALGRGNGGDVSILASERVFVAGSNDLFTSLIGAVNLGTGDSGDLFISSPEVTLVGGGSIFTDAFGLGAGGDLVIETEQLSVSGNGGERFTEVLDRLSPEDQERFAREGRLVVPSSITADAGADGTAGSIRIDAAEIMLADGGEITSSTTGSASGGSIVIRAGRLTLDGLVSEESTITRIATDSGVPGAEAFTDATGDGGTISIEVGELTMSNGATISSESVESGNGGTIDILADNVTLRGQATISSQSYGTGDAGNISVLARDDVLIEDSEISAEAKQSGGNIDISAGNTLILSEGDLSTEASGTGDGGNITIGADEAAGISRPDAVVLQKASMILASAVEGAGGNIDISTDVLFQSPDSMIDASSRLGVDGRVTGVSPEVLAEPAVQGITVSYRDPTPLLQRACTSAESSFTVRRQQGEPLSPEEMLLAFDFRPGAGSGSIADPMLSEGMIAMASGDFELAAEVLRGAEREFEATGQPLEQSDALRGIAHNMQLRGRYAAAVNPLKAALQIAETHQDPARQAAALGALGTTYIALGDYGNADALLKRAVILASQAADSTGAGVQLTQTYNEIGNLESARKNFPAALDAYKKSISVASGGQDPLLKLSAMANIPRTMIALGDHAGAMGFLEEASLTAYSVEPIDRRVNPLIHLGRTYAEVAALDTPEHETALWKAYESFSTAEALAGDASRRRARSIAIGNMALLYEQESRYAEAQLLAERALEIADAVGAAEIEQRWWHLLGRLYWTQGRPRASIDAYRNAVTIVDELRLGSLAYYGPNDHFTSAVAPVYTDLADALLQAADLVGPGHDTVALLEEARQSMERLKAAELRDYFKDDCIAQSFDDSSVPEGVAVVYPILLRDRLELLVNFPGGLERFRVDGASASEVAAQADALRSALQKPGTRGYAGPSRRLYRWLIAPFADRLEEERTQTLVFVPAEALRSIPIAALNDGKQFVVERYASVVVPSMGLVDRAAAGEIPPEALLVGLSEQVEDFPALPNVPGELAAIQALYGGRMLLDEAFTVARFERSMDDRQPSIVHIASHGWFTDDPNSSFLVTHDGRLSVGDLERTVRSRELPLDLLVFSACDTAIGDDRAALGLAGTVTRAGSRSAIGSLWKVSDAATAELFKAFYEQLRENEAPKGLALQAAQRELIAGRFAHPFYWSGFLLVGNWL